MGHSLPGTDRVAPPWPLTGRLDWLHQFPTGLLRGILRFCGFGSGMPVLRVSDEWLDEYERRSRKHATDG